MSTIYEVTARLPDEGYPRPVIILPGEGRSYSIGDVAYRTARPLFPDGSVQTLPRFASLMPVMFIDGEWRSVYANGSNHRRLIKNWSEKCTLVERL